MAKLEADPIATFKRLVSDAAQLYQGCRQSLLLAGVMRIAILDFGLMEKLRRYLNGSKTMRGI